MKESIGAIRYRLISDEVTFEIQNSILFVSLSLEDCESINFGS